MKKEELKVALYNYYRHYKKFPKINWLAQKVGISESEVKKILRDLEKEGFIKRKYNKYNIEQRKDKDYISIVIRIVMGFVGLGASIMSIYYTYIWLREFLNIFLAFLLSFIMVIFSVFAFETFLYLRIRKQKIGYLLLFPWVVVLIFSMLSTVAGQYNRRYKEIKTYVEFNISNDEKVFIQKQLEQKQEERMIYQNILSKFDTYEKRKKDWKYYWNTYRQLENVDKEIEILMEKLKEVNKTVVENAIYTRDFYSWIGRVLNLRRDLVEFWMSLFPAIFIDIIAPLSFAISLFLKKIF